MDKKSVSATILVLFLALVFAVVGACFSAFVYQKNIIEFKEGSDSWCLIFVGYRYIYIF